MARARNIKPALFKNEILGAADPLYTLLFIELWMLADRDGRLEDRPLRIKAETFPYRDGIDIENLLNWLQANEFITRYQVAGNRYIQVLNFAKHQNPHRNEKASTIPAPEISGRVPNKSVDDRNFSEAIPLSPDSCNPIPDCFDTSTVDAVDDASGKASPPFDAHAHLVSLGVDGQVASDWLKLRKAKKAPATMTAFNGIQKEASKAGITMQAAIERCCQRNWAGFEAEWVLNGASYLQTSVHNPSYAERRDTERKNTVAILTGTTKAPVGPERDITAEVQRVI